MQNEISELRTKRFIKERFKRRNTKKLSINNMQMVYVVSRLKGDINENTKCAKKYCRFVYEKNLMPIASHIMYPAMGFDDENKEERDDCRLFGLYLLSLCDKVFCFIKNGEVSEGMVMEIQTAKKLNIPIEYYDVLEDETYEYKGPRYN